MRAGHIGISPKREAELSSAKHCRVEGEPAMTELEVLDSNIDGLKKLLRVAWRDLANPSLPPFEHREVRNQIKQYSVELRRYLQLKEAERRRPQSQFLVGHGFGKPPLRIPA
jgi:hypothetical protein